MRGVDAGAVGFGYIGRASRSVCIDVIAWMREVDSQDWKTCSDLLVCVVWCIWKHRFILAGRCAFRFLGCID